MQVGDLIKDAGYWEFPPVYKKKSQLGLVLEANISPMGRNALEKRAKILWDNGCVSTVPAWTVEVISEGR